MSFLRNFKVNKHKKIRIVIEDGKTNQSISNTRFRLFAKTVYVRVKGLNYKMKHEEKKTKHQQLLKDNKHNTLTETVSKINTY